MPSSLIGTIGLLQLCSDSLTPEQIAVLGRADMIILDQFSTMPAYVLSALDAALRKYANSRTPNSLFIGMQIIAIKDYAIMKQCYAMSLDGGNMGGVGNPQGMFAFNSPLLAQANFKEIVLTHVYSSNMYASPDNSSLSWPRRLGHFNPNADC